MKRVLLLLAQGFEAYEAAVFTDVLGWSCTDGLERVEVTTVGLRKRIECTWSLVVEPQYLLEDVELTDYDALAIPGGFEEAGFYEEAYDERFLQAIRHFNSKRKPIAAVCVGSLPVGKSGVLKNRAGTTYHLGAGERRRQLAEFGVDVQDNLLVVDKNIITSSCPSTGLDVAFTLLEMLTSPQNRETVEEAMGF